MESDSIGHTSKNTEKDDDDERNNTRKENVNSMIEGSSKVSVSNDVGVNVEDLVSDEMRKKTNILQDVRPFERLTIDTDDNDAKLYNTRALTKHAPTYELEKFKKKALIIFNHKHFKGKKHKTRLGSEHDVKALRNTFEKCGFDVVEHRDLTKEQVFKELKTFSMIDFTDYGCVAIAVLTHGRDDKLRAYDQAFYSEAEILHYFNISGKPTLVTKPRILIVQACRGGDPHDGIEVQAAETIQADDDSDGESYYLPKESDLLILYSSYRGKPSYRDALEGSWFIQSLCKKVDELAATHDLESIVTEVKREVAIDRVHEEFNIETLKVEYRKQMPEVKTTLIRKLYLKNYGDNAPCLPYLSPNSILNSPLTDFDHFSYTWNCMRLTDWMSTIETSLQSAECSEEYFLRLSQEVEEFKCVLDNINLIGPQVFKTLTGASTMPIEEILTRHNRRFDAITERVQAMSKIQEIQVNVEKTEENIPTGPASVHPNEIVENNLQEFETKLQSISNTEEIVIEMKKLLSWLQYCSDSISKLTMDTNDRQTLELKQAKLKFILKDIARYQSRLNILDEAAKQILIGIEGTEEADEIMKTLATLHDKCGQMQEEVTKQEKETENAFKKCAPKVKQQLEEAVKLEGTIAEFKEMLRSFSDGLEATEKYLASVQPVSMVVETLRGQLSEHVEILRELLSHSSTWNNLINNTQFAQIRDIYEYKKSLSLLLTRLRIIVQSCSSRIKSLTNARIEASKFRDMWDELMIWLNNADEQFNNIDSAISVKDGFEKRLNRTKAISEFEKKLDAKKALYEQAMETGKYLVQKAPKTDERTLQTMISDLKVRWDNLNSRAPKEVETKTSDHILNNYMYMLNQNTGEKNSSNHT